MIWLNPRIVRADSSLLPQALALLWDTYRQARASSPLLPDVSELEQERLQEQLKEALDTMAVAAVSGDQIVGFLGVSAQFPTRGQKAALIQEFGHAAAGQDRRRVYQHLYAALAKEMVARGVHLHLIGHFSSDVHLTDALFELGFGAILTERLRDLSDLPQPAAADIVEEHRWDAVTDLETEHRRYYRNAPIFLMKEDSPSDIARGLAQYQQDGDRLFVCREAGEPRAYLVAGRCPGVHEGQLLFGTNTAQIKTAYAAPSVRGKGIGLALLQRALQWARESGYDRMFVEHETANISGGNFWRRHFRPYLYYSMRYIDSRL